MINQYLSPLETADYLFDHGVGRTLNTLAKYRCKGGGPNFHRAGRGILYAMEDLDAWMVGEITKAGPPTSKPARGAV